MGVGVGVGVPLGMSTAGTDSGARPVVSCRREALQAGGAIANREPLWAPTDVVADGVGQQWPGLARSGLRRVAFFKASSRCPVLAVAFGASSAGFFRSSLRQRSLTAPSASSLPCPLAARRQLQHAHAHAHHVCFLPRPPPSLHHARCPRRRPSHGQHDSARSIPLPSRLTASSRPSCPPLNNPSADRLAVVMPVFAPLLSSAPPLTVLPAPSRKTPRKLRRKNPPASLSTNHQKLPSSAGSSMKSRPTSSREIPHAATWQGVPDKHSSRMSMDTHYDHKWFPDELRRPTGLRPSPQPSPGLPPSPGQALPRHHSMPVGSVLTRELTREREAVEQFDFGMGSVTVDAQPSLPAQYTYDNTAFGLSVSAEVQHRRNTPVYSKKSWSPGKSKPAAPAIDTSTPSTPPTKKSWSEPSAPALDTSVQSRTLKVMNPDDASPVLPPLPPFNPGFEASSSSSSTSSQESVVPPLRIQKVGQSSPVLTGSPAPGTPTPPVPVPASPSSPTYPGRRRYSRATSGSPPPTPMQSALEVPPVPAKDARRRSWSLSQASSSQASVTAPPMDIIERGHTPRAITTDEPVLLAPSGSTSSSSNASTASDPFITPPSRPVTRDAPKPSDSTSFLGGWKLAIQNLTGTDAGSNSKDAPIGVGTGGGWITRRRGSFSSPRPPSADHKSYAQEYREFRAGKGNTTSASASGSSSKRSSGDSTGGESLAQRAVSVVRSASRKSKDRAEKEQKEEKKEKEVGSPNRLRRRSGSLPAANTITTTTTATAAAAAAIPPLPLPDPPLTPTIRLTSPTPVPEPISPVDSDAHERHLRRLAATGAYPDAARKVQEADLVSLDKAVRQMAALEEHLKAGRPISPPDSDDETHARNHQPQKQHQQQQLSMSLPQRLQPAPPPGHRSNKGKSLSPLRNEVGDSGSERSRSTSSVAVMGLGVNININGAEGSSGGTSAEIVKRDSAGVLKPAATNGSSRPSTPPKPIAKLFVVSFHPVEGRW